MMTAEEVELVRSHLLDLHRVLQRKDEYALFARPAIEDLSEEVAKDYLERIEEPMDFYTMKVKLLEGKYDANHGDFARDFKLLCTNCQDYNEEGLFVAMCWLA